MNARIYRNEDLFSAKAAGGHLHLKSVIANKRDDMRMQAQQGPVWRRSILLYDATAAGGFQA
jgi:hypothetical protein